MNNLNDPMELAAIWLDKPANGKVRITAGDYIAVNHGQLISASHATHKILGCYGDLYSNSLFILIIDILTNEPQFLTIK